MLVVLTSAKSYSQNSTITGKWTGARLIPLAGGGIHTDSTWIEFKKDGTLTFKHQKYEFNGPTSGTWSFQKNTLRVSIVKFPFNHTFEGTIDNNNNNISITGFFKEIREKDPTQPAYYVPGVDSGTFTLIKNL